MKAKVKVGRTKLALKTGIFSWGTSSQPMKRAVTALAFVVVVQFRPFPYYCCLIIYMKWEEILFHWFKLTQSELKKELSMFTFHLAFVSKSKSLSLYLLKWRPDLFIPRLKTNTFVLHLLMFCPEKTYLESPGNAQKCSREHLKSQNFRGPWAGPEPHAMASQIVGKTQTKTPTYFILFHWFKLIQSELKNEVKLW